MKLLYVAAAFLLACFALAALAQGQKSAPPEKAARVSSTTE